jgi:hypothetical protein
MESIVSKGPGKSWATMVTSYPASWRRMAQLRPMTPALWTVSQELLCEKKYEDFDSPDNNNVFGHFLEVRIGCWQANWGQRTTAYEGVRSRCSR